MELRPLQDRVAVGRLLDVKAGNLNFGSIGRWRSLRDALVVAFLAILLGGFVAQISSAFRSLS